MTGFSFVLGCEDAPIRPVHPAAHGLKDLARARGWDAHLRSLCVTPPLEEYVDAFVVQLRAAMGEATPVSMNEADRCQQQRVVRQLGYPRRTGSRTREAA